MYTQKLESQMVKCSSRPGCHTFMTHYTISRESGIFMIGVRRRIIITWMACETIGGCPSVFTILMTLCAIQGFMYPLQWKCRVVKYTTFPGELTLMTDHAILRKVIHSVVRIVCFFIILKVARYTVTCHPIMETDFMTIKTVQSLMSTFTLKPGLYTMVPWIWF